MKSIDSRKSPRTPTRRVVERPQSGAILPKSAYLGGPMRRRLGFKQ